MPRDNESLIDIERAARRVIRYAADCDRASLQINDEKVSAILYQITIIGEAAKRLSQDFRQQYPEIPWREITGMRDVIVHDYDQVDLDIVWDVIQNKLPELLISLQSLLPSEDS